MNKEISCELITLGFSQKNTLCAHYAHTVIAESEESWGGRSIVYNRKKTFAILIDFLLLHVELNIMYSRVKRDEIN